MQEDLRVKHTLEEIRFTFFFFFLKVNLNSFKTVRHSQLRSEPGTKRQIVAQVWVSEARFQQGKGPLAAFSPSAKFSLRSACMG